MLVTASIAAHRTSLEPCLVIRPRRTLTSGSRCLGVNPAQLHNVWGLGKRVTSPISAHEDGPQRASHPVDGLDGPVAGVVFEPAVDLAFQHGDLPVIGAHQIAEG